MPNSSDIPIPGAPLNSRTRKRRPIPRHLPGHIAGRYRVLSMLGRGATGIVVEAYDLLDDRLVALKLLKRECARDAKVLQRFIQEARAMGKVDHPGVVKVFEHGVDKSGLHFLVMDIVKGLSVAEYIEDRGRMPARWVARLGMEICEVMQVAHDMKVVHRDLKPSNVLLPDGWFQGKATVRVVDFGTAKIATNTASFSMRKLTGQGELVGTPQYMSPEQAIGRPITGRSDLYSLGCVLYEALSGHLPFDGPNHFAIIVGHLEREAVSLTDLMGPQEAPPALTSIIRALLAKEPDERPVSAEGVRARLQQMLGDLPAEHSGARVPPPGQHRDHRSASGSRRAGGGGRGAVSMGLSSNSTRGEAVEAITSPRVSEVRSSKGAGAEGHFDLGAEPPTRREEMPPEALAAMASMPEPDMFSDSTTVTADPRFEAPEVTIGPLPTSEALGLEEIGDDIPSFDLDMMSSVDEGSPPEPASASLSALVRHNMEASRAQPEPEPDTEPMARPTPFSAPAAPRPGPAVAPGGVSGGGGPFTTSAAQPRRSSPPPPALKRAQAPLPSAMTEEPGRSKEPKATTAPLPSVSSLSPGAARTTRTSTVPLSSVSLPPAPPAGAAVDARQPEAAVMPSGADAATPQPVDVAAALSAAPPGVDADEVEAPVARAYQAPDTPFEQEEPLAPDGGSRSAAFWLLSLGAVVLLGGVVGVLAYTGYTLFAQSAQVEAPAGGDERALNDDGDERPSAEGGGAVTAQDKLADGEGEAGDDAAPGEGGEDKPSGDVAEGARKVRLTSSPKGATVWRGDEELGVTPLDLTLSAQTKWPAVFLLTAPGRASAYAVVEAPGSEQDDFKSEHKLARAGRGVARVEVLTETAGAEVFEDGVLVGFTPVHLARPRREGSVALTIVYDDKKTRKLRVGLGAQDIVLNVPDDVSLDAKPEPSSR